jgi:excisionase family DNA binding protein
MNMLASHRKAKPKPAREAKLTRRERALEEFHAWHIKYDDLEEFAQVERQVMDVEDALSKMEAQSGTRGFQTVVASSVKRNKAMPEPLPKRLRDVSEVAAYLGKSEQFVRRSIHSKRLEAIKVGGEWRISDEAICKFLEDGMNVKK